MKNAIVISGSRFNWDDGEEQMNNVITPGGDVNWRAAFAADPGVTYCPGCKEAFWKEGDVLQCPDCNSAWYVDSGKLVPDFSTYLLELKTKNNLELIGSFVDHVKQEMNFVIPENVVVSFFE